MSLLRQKLHWSATGARPLYREIRTSQIL